MENHISPAVASFSLATRCSRSPSVDAAINALVEEGVAVVAAAGYALLWHVRNVIVVVCVTATCCMPEDEATHRKDCDTWDIHDLVGLL